MLSALAMSGVGHHAYHAHAGVPDFVLTLIVVGYLVIAAQFAMALKNVRPEMRRARVSLGVLVATFVLCSSSGYLPRVLPFPDWWHLASHLVLMSCTWTYILLGEANRVAKALQ